MAVSFCYCYIFGCWWWSKHKILDTWLNGCSIEVLAPRLFACVPNERIDNKQTVQEALINNRWLEDIRSHFSVAVLSEFHDIWPFGTWYKRWCYSQILRMFINHKWRFCLEASPGVGSPPNQLIPHFFSNDFENMDSQGNVSFSYS